MALEWYIYYFTYIHVCSFHNYVYMNIKKWNENMHFICDSIDHNTINLMKYHKIFV